MRPGAPLGGPPIGLGVAGAVAQGGRGHQHPVGRGEDDFGERLRRVDPMAVQADVDIAAVEAGDPAAVLGGAIGGEGESPAAGAGLDNVADTAIGAAIDSATDQGLAEGQPDAATPVDAPDDVVVVEDVPEDDSAPEDVSPV